MPNDLTPELAETLGQRLPGAVTLKVEEGYLREPRGLWKGRAAALVRPSNVDEVARAIRFASAHGLAVQPYGGGTGLVGGQLTNCAPRPILLSLERMNRLRAVHRSENVLIAEGGVILADVHAAAAEHDRLFPLSLASEGSARIGGLLSTNAGGVNVLRYGNARDLCLGIEAVLPDGSIYNGLHRLRKNNTGYDLRNLLIGAEGTLGIITAAALRLFPRPARHGAALMVVPGPEAALELLAMAQNRGGVSAFELISGEGMRFLGQAGLPVRQPFGEIPDWCVLIDIALENEAGDPQALLENLFLAGSGAGLTDDGVIAQNTGQRAELWKLRESIPEANRRIGAILSNDISLPLSCIGAFLGEAGVMVAKEGPFRINAFGHLGDGNLHYNIFPPEGETRDAYMPAAPMLRKSIDALVVSLGGSFSAEHGIGRAKVEVLERHGDPAALAAMRAIKTALDPRGIMNPGAVLRRG
ncbi:FAD-binding oxidoreductase [Profundibacterium mesophilum]|uniref:D-lactate dehydrogenase n=1 Tax=Profundibacterium mesophilum KAUST100406-0324 TaxID=1037889 RepID=A0A921TCL0_9RHOB|nr:FAD-binding oxidoreductase [Profundibacterium mesophilum]KAF0675793.1 D-lactate dehydrogenase [Profundibacterium mesophilum KAUST100406-0324]